MGVRDWEAMRIPLPGRAAPGAGLLFGEKSAVFAEC
jgi:hypothetical protein